MTIASSFILKLLLSVAVLLNLVCITSCNQATSAEKIPITFAVDSAPPKSTVSTKPVPTTTTKNTSTRCPVCKKRKSTSEEICSDCHNEVANTCYRCDRIEYGVNGKLCSKCSKTICALCNRKKDSKDDDLCARCHNSIETKKKK